MNQDNLPADHVEAHQRQAMLRDWRALLSREIVVTAVIDLAALIQTLQVAQTRSTSSVDDTRGRASVTTGLGAAALITLVGAVVAVVTVL